MFLVLQHVFFEALIDIVYAPIWWYSKGVHYWSKKCIQWFYTGNDILNPEIWLKNIFIPMYGQYDWQGRLISFFIRLIQVIVRGFLLGIWSMICSTIFVMWFIIPPIFVYGFLSAFVR
jgi:hypothetical protein